MTRKEIKEEAKGIFPDEFAEANAINLATWAVNHQIDSIIATIRRDQSWVGKIDLLDDLIYQIKEHKL